MWKKFASACVFVVAAALGSQASLAADSQYKEGVNYEVKNGDLTKVKEIREYMSFWCSHCNQLQGTFNKIESAFPQANFVRNPVPMLGGPMGPESQRAYAVAENMGIGDQFAKELFKQIHELNNIPTTHDEMTKIITSLGVDKARYEREYNSFPIIGKVSEYNKWDDYIQIDAVPEILVNGKYLVTMESVKNDQELISLIDYLLNKDDVPSVANAPKAANAEDVVSK